MSGMDKKGKLGAGGEFAKQATAWMTPNSRDADKWNNRAPGSGHNANLSGQVSTTWPTPDTNESTYSNGVMGQNIREATANWPTPRSEDAEACGNHPGAEGLTGRGNAPVDNATGSRHPSRRTVSDEAKEQAGGVRQLDGRSDAVWHTPSTEDGKTDGPKALGRYGTEEMKTSDQRLRNQVMKWDE